jgi:diguanylate cyclase (GGDEF)-like protein
VTVTLDDVALMSFEQASDAVVAYLKEKVPLGFWSVSEYRDGRQVYLSVQDDAYGKVAGDSHAWSDSFCQYMVTGQTPQIAPDAMAVPQYAAAGVAQVLPIGAYVGVPIRGGDGELFGTLCGLDPEIAGPDLLAQAPGLQLLSTLLSQILQADRLRADGEAREAELQWRAFHDQLTGLPNRAMLLDRLQHALDLQRRDLRTVAVLLIDLDDFKAVNDTLGHAAGDELLIRVGERLRGALRAGDTVARLGGDEFAVLLEDGGEPAVVADHIASCLDEPYRIADTTVRAGASMVSTVTRLESVGRSASPMLARADLAMYSAKRAGKGRLAVYDALMTAPEGRDLQLREHLRAAVASGAITAAFQPVVNLGTKEPIGFECLARWHHDGADIPPAVFIPMAARTGLLSDLTDHMLDLAGAQLQAWSRQLGHHRLCVGVNVPPDLLVDSTFPDRVGDRIRRFDLHRGQLVLEITEDALMSNPSAARAVSHQLLDLGVLLSLDDFGAGYSSLLHLQQIPLHSLKVDRGFIGDLDTNANTERFMKAVLSLGRDLGLRVIVEGVERPAQAAVLQALGCTHAQGYLFGRPTVGADADLTNAFAAVTRT